MSWIEFFAFREAKKTIEKEFPFLCDECKKQMIEKYTKDYKRLFIIFGLAFFIITVLIVLKIVI